jgi:hypothetical protein
LATDSQAVDELARLVGWTGRAAYVPDWEVTERLLGSPLPTDYKELLRVFPAGEFGGTALVQPPRATGHEGDLLYLFEQVLRDLRKKKGSLYAVYPDRPGLIPWANCYAGNAAELFWLAGDGDPDTWPVVLSGRGKPQWERFEVGAVEFLTGMVRGEVPSRILPEIAGPPTFQSFGK